jgi:bla regulator protein blaR1
VADFKRVELALWALALTAALFMLVVTLDAAHHHGWLVVAVAAADLFVLARAAGSLARQVRAHSAFLRALPVRGDALVHGHRVRVLPGRAPGAFCAGLLRPRVYVSDGTLSAAADAELQAILAHEEHHRARRDPLRLLLARTVADAFHPLPPFASLAERETAVADLAADAAAVHAVGSASPLAAALDRFADGGVAPVRVDRLVGAAPAGTVPVVLLAAAGLALVASMAFEEPLFVGHHPAHEPSLLLAAFIPACLAARRAGAFLRPAT